MATRILAEFTGYGPRPELDYLGPEVIVLTARPGELPYMAERLRELLAEERFVGWELVIYGE